MKWFEEARCQIMRRSVEERGFLFTVREIFNNSAFVPMRDMEVVFGKEWNVTLEGLKKTGLLEVLRGRDFVQMSVHLPGDKRREYMREKMRERRKKHEEAREE